MVKVKTSRISLLFAISSAFIEVSSLLAYSSTSSGKSCGRPYWARIECISVSCSPGIPRVRKTVPKGESALSGQSSMRTSTFSPSFASPIFLRGTKISVYILPSAEVLTKANFFCICITPTNSSVLRCKTFTISPSCFLLRLCL